MKFRDKRTGAILEPSDQVAAMMANDPNLEKVEEKPKAAPKKTTRKRTTKE
jgi:hypothetical protein